MRWRRLFLILISLALVSSVYLTTLARYSDEYVGLDASLVARWNFGARGEEDIEGVFYNKGFTFDLFNAQSVKPMDHGMKSFVFTGGGSDVGIAYDVEMNVQDLQWLASGTVAQRDGVDIYAPFIFRITAEINGGGGGEGDTDALPVIFSPGADLEGEGGGAGSAAPPGDNNSGWFRPGDIAAAETIAVDEDGFFSIFDITGGAPSFSAGSGDQVTVTVEWQWNTSFYMNDSGAGGTDVSPVTPDASTGEGSSLLPYYWAAYHVYYGPGGLHDQWLAASQALTDYLNAHGGFPGSTPGGSGGEGSEGGDGSPDPEEQGEGEPGDEGAGEPGAPDSGEGGGDPPEEGYPPAPLDGDSFDYDIYNQLVAALNEAAEACNTSLMAAYDDYDTRAVDALVALDAVKIIFRIKGDQMSPDQGEGPQEARANEPEAGTNGVMASLLPGNEPAKLLAAGKKMNSKENSS